MYDQKDHGASGHFRTSVNMSLTALQAQGGILLSMRWTDTTYLLILEKLILSFLQTAAATATIFPAFECRVARGFTAADTLGNIMTITGDNGKKRTNHATTKVQEIRYATGLAAGLTAGTRTKDTHPFLTVPAVSVITTPPNVAYKGEFQATTDECPIILAANEGIIIEGPTTAFGAAGTGNLYVDIVWKEVLAFEL